MVKLIAIDAGHGGRDPGAVNAALGLKEKDITLAVAQHLKAILHIRGNLIVMTRELDTTINLPQRVGRVNTSGAMALISIHCNAAKIMGATGIETYHRRNSEVGKDFAGAIQRSLIAAFPGHKDRGVKAESFFMLKNVPMPACLVELEFLSNDEQAKFLKDTNCQTKIAGALADGIDNYFVAA